MTDILSAINGLKRMKHLTPASHEAIDKAESQLGLRFAPEYRRYVATFGAISAIGVELTGVTEAKRLDVVRVTEREREFNPLLPPDCYVVEVLGIDGVIAIQNEGGRIFALSPYKAPAPICDSLSDYLKGEKSR